MKFGDKELADELVELILSFLKYSEVNGVSQKWNSFAVSRLWLTTSRLGRDLQAHRFEDESEFLSFETFNPWEILSNRGSFVLPRLHYVLPQILGLQTWYQIDVLLQRAPAPSANLRTGRRLRKRRSNRWTRRSNVEYLDVGDSFEQSCETDNLLAVHCWDSVFRCFTELLERRFLVDTDCAEFQEIIESAYQSARVFAETTVSYGASFFELEFFRKRDRSLFSKIETAVDILLDLERIMQADKQHKSNSVHDSLTVLPVIMALNDECPTLLQPCKPKILSFVFEEPLSPEEGLLRVRNYQDYDFLVPDLDTDLFLKYFPQMISMIVCNPSVAFSPLKEQISEFVDYCPRKFLPFLPDVVHENYLLGKGTRVPLAQVLEDLIIPFLLDGLFDRRKRENENEKEKEKEKEDEKKALIALSGKVIELMKKIGLGLIVRKKLLPSVGMLCCDLLFENEDLEIAAASQDLAQGLVDLFERKETTEYCLGCVLKEVLSNENERGKGKGYYSKRHLGFIESKLETMRRIINERKFAQNPRINRYLREATDLNTNKKRDDEGDSLDYSFSLFAESDANLRLLL